ncbi:MAG: DUF1697 domain-containing protein [Actinomycetia bacterium]|nr:DUF1697 domain-containing protein [Actinomycetes bacterium]
MNTWIVLLRGINVGGSNRLPMADLRAALSDDGFTDVCTYIQSGNIVLSAEDGLDTGAVAARIGATIDHRFGFSPSVWAITLDRFDEVIEANPFPQAAAYPKLVHFVLTAGPPAPSTLDELSALVVPGEEVHVEGDMIYLFAPHGIGRSKMAAAVGKASRTNTTSRNYRSIMAIRKLAEQGR